MINFFKRRRPTHRAKVYGYKFTKPEPDICRPCVDLYGIEAVRAATPAVSIQDLIILRWHGYTPAQWATLPALVQVDKRESYFQSVGLA